MIGLEGIPQMGTEDKTKKLKSDDPYRLPMAVSDIERRLAAIEERFKSGGYMTRPQHEETVRHLQEKSLDHANRIGRLEQRIGAGEGVPLIYEKDFAYFTPPPEHDGPFCLKCYDEKTKRCRLIRKNGYTEGFHTCVVCGAGYWEPGTAPESDRVLSSSGGDRFRGF